MALTDGEASTLRTMAGRLADEDPALADSLSRFRLGPGRLPVRRMVGAWLVTLSAVIVCALTLHNAALLFLAVSFLLLSPILAWAAMRHYGLDLRSAGLRRPRSR